MMFFGFLEVLEVLEGLEILEGLEGGFQTITTWELKDIIPRKKPHALMTHEAFKFSVNDKS